MYILLLQVSLTYEKTYELSSFQSSRRILYWMNSEQLLNLLFKEGLCTYDQRRREIGYESLSYDNIFIFFNYRWAGKNQKYAEKKKVFRDQS